MVSHLESCWVLGFHSKVEFRLGNSYGPSVYTCLACRSISWLWLVIAALVTSIFPVIDEGFVPTCVGSCTTVCGWLRFNEVLGKNYYWYLCFFTLLFRYISVYISVKSYDIMVVLTGDSLPFCVVGAKLGQPLAYG